MTKETINKSFTPLIQYIINFNKILHYFLCVMLIMHLIKKFQQYFAVKFKKNSLEGVKSDNCSVRKTGVTKFMFEF